MFVNVCAHLWCSICLGFSFTLSTQILILSWIVSHLLFFFVHTLQLHEISWWNEHFQCCYYFACFLFVCHFCKAFSIIPALTSLANLSPSFENVALFFLKNFPSLKYTKCNFIFSLLLLLLFFFFFAVLKNTHPFSVVNARFCFSLIFVLDFSFLSRRYLSDSKYTEKMRHFMNEDSRNSCACFSDWDHSLCPSMFMTQMLENGTECEFKYWRKKPTTLTLFTFHQAWIN